MNTFLNVFAFLGKFILTYAPKHEIAGLWGIFKIDRLCHIAFQNFLSYLYFL